MNDDCNDSDGAPDTTLEGLIGEFERAGQTFRDEAATNRQKRRNAEEPTGAFEGLADGEDFVARPYLLVPHYDGSPKRPVPRRSEISDAEMPPIRSESLRVTERGGETAEAIAPGNSYTVECTVRNLGGVSARGVRVELYVEHKKPNAKIDTVGESVELPRTGTGAVTGVTTMAPDSRITVVTYAHRTDRLVHENVLHHSNELEVADDRTFRAELGGIPDTFGITDEPVPDDLTEFTVRVWETTFVRLSPTNPGTPANRILLAEAPGTFVDGSDRENPGATGDGPQIGDPGELVDVPAIPDRKNHELTSSVPATETAAVGQTAHTSIPPTGQRTVTFEYTPTADEFPTPNEGLEEGTVDDMRESVFWDIDEDDGPGIGRAVTAFYVRAYAPATAETPANWDDLDHTSSRFMGRTDIPRITFNS